jgi:hypothetical protein
MLMAACGNDGGVDLPSAGSWESMHFDYRTRASEDVACPDILGPLEDHFAFMQAYLGFDWPAGANIQYYKFVDLADFEAHAGCPTGTSGCAPPGAVRSPYPMHKHELVHAYLAFTGHPPGVITEGIAVALSCQARAYADSKPTLSWDELAALEFSPDNNDVYAAGAWLVGYLLDTFGPQAFVALYRTLPRGADANTMDAAFRDAYGQSLSAIWAAALDEDQPRNTCVSECSRPALSLDGTSVGTNAACGATVTRPFTLPADATISFSTTTAYIGLGPCGQHNVPWGLVKGNVLALYVLPAGEYFVEHSGADGTITGRADASASLSPVCAAVTADVTGSNVESVFVAVPPTPSNWFLSLPPPRASLPLLLSVHGSTTTASEAVASVCTSCEHTSCTVAGSTVTWAPGVIVNLATDPAQPFTELLLFR